MLRIIRIETTAESRWVLIGQLAGRWVHELRSQWREVTWLGATDVAGAEMGPCPPPPVVAQEITPKRSVVDLTDVTFIDEDGEALLEEMKQQGIDLIAGSGVENRDLLENLRTKGRRSVRRMLGRTNDAY